MSIHNTRGRIDALRQEARALVSAAGENAMSTEQETRFAAIEAETASLRTRERQLAFLDDQDRAAPAADPRFEELRSGVSLSAVIRAQLAETRNSHEAGRVRELSAEISRRSGRNPSAGLWFDARNAPTLQRRDLTIASASALVPTIQRGDLFTDVLRNNLVVERAGATVITGLTGGEVAIPRRITPVGAAFVAEQQPLPLSDGAYDQLKMHARTAGLISEISRSLVIQSDPSAEGLVMQDQAAGLAQLIDAAVLTGDGVGANPLGITKQATAVSYSGAAPSYLDVLNALDTLEHGNVNPNAWVIGGNVRAKLMAQPRSTTASEGFVMTDRNALIGLPALQTGNMPTGSLLVGDFSQVVVGYWSAVQISVNELAEAAFMKGAVLVRAIVSMDVAVRQPAAFVLLGKATT